MTHTFALLLAQDQAPAQGAGGGMSLFALQIVLVIGIFYFILIRPQKKQRDAHEERLRNVRKGDEIVTAGGIVGKVENVKEAIKDGATVKTMEDRITIRSAESRLIIERGRIARVITEPVSTPAPAAESKTT